MRYRDGVMPLNTQEPRSTINCALITALACRPPDSPSGGWLGMFWFAVRHLVCRDGATANSSGKPEILEHINKLIVKTLKEQRRVAGVVVSVNSIRSLRC